MEISLEAIISIIGLFVGGSGGAFFTWRYAKKKAAAEAKEAESIAEKAKFEAVQASIAATKEVQDSYQQMIADMKENIDYQKEDRRTLRQERDELRARLDALESTVRQLRMDVARNGNMVRSLRPFLCGREKCPNRIVVTLSDLEAADTAPEDIEPYNENDK